MAEIDYGVIDLTPAAARQILERNTRNRSLHEDYVRKLAGAMERGEWMVNGEPIQIAEDGVLLNGQHRLNAIVASGVTVPMLVVRGLPSTTQMTMDVGTRRNLSDVLALHGESDTTNLGAMLGMLHRYRNGDRLDNSGRTAPTATEALARLEEEPRIKEYLPLGRKVLRVTHMRVSVSALLAYLFDGVDPKEGTRFFETLCNAPAEPQGSPVRALRSILDRSYSERTYRISTYVLTAMTIKAFNAWREGREMALLLFRPGGPSRETFPKILTRAEIEASSTTPDAEVSDSAVVGFADDEVGFL
jgi:hypothetical protein